MKKQQSTTSNYKVTPIRGEQKAPYFVVGVSRNEKDPEGKAIKMVLPKTRLSAFKEWEFEAERV